MAAKVGDTSVGIAFGGVSVDSTVTATNLTTGSSASAENTDNTTYEAFRVEKYYDYGRMGIELGHLNKKDGATADYFGVEYAYMVYNESIFTPFLGVLADYKRSEITDSSSTIDKSSYDYGLEIGAVIAITKAIDLEIGGRYLRSTLSYEDIQTVAVDPIKTSMDVDNVMQYYFGVNYNF